MNMDVEGVGLLRISVNLTGVDVTGIEQAFLLGGYLI